MTYLEQVTQLVTRHPELADIIIDHELKHAKDCVASFSDLVGLHILEQKIALGVNINAGTGNEESK